MADRLLGLDEGAADVVVADQADLERQPRLAGIAQRGEHAAVGHRPRRGRPPPAPRAPGRHRPGCGSWRPTRQRRPSRGARSRPARKRSALAARSRTCGRSPASRRGPRPPRPAGARAARRRPAGPWRRSPRQSRCAPGSRPAAAAGSRAGPAPQPGGVGQQQQRVGALHPFQRDHQRLHRAVARVAGHEVQDHFGVARGLEDRPLLLELPPQPAGIDQVAVVHQAQRPHRRLDDDRLRVVEHAVAGRRVAGVADRAPARQPRQRLLREDVGNVAHSPLGVQLAVVQETMPALSWPRCCRA